MGFVLKQAIWCRRRFALQGLRFQSCVMTGVALLSLGTASHIKAQTTPHRASGLVRQTANVADQNAAVVAQISAAVQSRDYRQALIICHAALQRTPGDPRLWTLQAISQAGTNNGAAAVLSYERAVKIAPNYLPAWQGLAQLEYGAHDPRARLTLEHLVSLAPNDTIAHAMLGALAFERKDCSSAVNEFNQARAVLGSRPDVVLQWGSCLMQLGRPKDAAGVLGPVLDATPNDALLRYDTALAQWRSGNAAGAQQTLGPLLSAAHPTSDALALDAEISEERGDTQHALDLLRSAILADPQNRDAYLEFARLAYEHASAQVGIDMVNIGLSKLPNDAELYFARGVLLAQNGQMQQSMADLDRAAELDPHLSFVGTAQGIAAAQAHQFGRAEQRLRDQTRQHPSDAAAWYLLAEALAEQPLEPGSSKHAEMLHAAQQAVRLDPKSAEAHSQLAAIYLRDNDPGKAIEECNAALIINPEDPQTLYQLLLATRKTGTKDQISALVKRLMAARQAAEQKDRNNNRQTLVEMPVASGARSHP